MIGVYFSGTGNTKHCVETFVREFELAGKNFSIEAENTVREICAHNEIVIGYPVQFSNLPKILRDFVVDNSSIWKGKRVFVIATMGLFSGDGAGLLARLLAGYGAFITGGLHLKMPDSIGDERALKRTLEQNRKLVRAAEEKIQKAAWKIRNGRPPQDGIGLLKHLTGLFGQRIYFRGKTKEYSDKLKIDTNKCVRCGRCLSICPMKNISIREGRMVQNGKCTMCYRCVNFCPAQAITLLGKKVYEQCCLEKYL